MKTCPKCKLKYLNSASVCVCGYNLFYQIPTSSLSGQRLEELRKSEAKAKLERAREEQIKRERERERQARQESQVTLSCVGCGATLRLRLHAENPQSRCPSCKTEYQIIRQGGETPVILVVPCLSDEKKHSRSGSRAKNSITPKVRAALGTLNLDETASLSDVRRAYRDGMSQYHPDKVAHLGQKLRELAESEAKELNRAYETLRGFFRED
jgi:DnaJ-domain-containing protein 1